MNFAFSHDDIPDWGRFMEVAAFFGFSVRVTGGLFKTHDINASAADFKALVDMASSA